MKCFQSQKLMTQFNQWKMSITGKKVRKRLKRLRSGWVAMSVHNAAVFCLNQGSGEEVHAKDTCSVSTKNEGEMKALKTKLLLLGKKFKLSIKDD